jgi:tRNA (guanine37-N1)-methyltransferase
MALIESSVLLLRGVLGDHASTAEESFTSGLLEYPHYTRPQLFEDRSVPDVLTGGNHSEISKFRHTRAEELTRQRRPDLWDKYEKAPKAFEKGPR